MSRSDGRGFFRLFRVSREIFLFPLLYEGSLSRARRTYGRQHYNDEVPAARGRRGWGRKPRCSNAVTGVIAGNEP